MSLPQDSSENPFQAPATQENLWTIDRSGVGERVADIVFVSIMGAMGGGVLACWLPQPMQSTHIVDLIVVGSTIGCLAIWACFKVGCMRKPVEPTGNDKAAGPN